MPNQRNSFIYERKFGIEKISGTPNDVLKFKKQQNDFKVKWFAIRRKWYVILSAFIFTLALIAAIINHYFPVSFTLPPFPKLF